MHMHVHAQAHVNSHVHMQLELQCPPHIPNASMMPLQPTLSHCAPLALYRPLPPSDLVVGDDDPCFCSDAPRRHLLPV